MHTYKWYQDRWPMALGSWPWVHVILTQTSFCTCPYTLVLYTASFIWYLFAYLYIFERAGSWRLGVGLLPFFGILTDSAIAYALLAGNTKTRFARYLAACSSGGLSSPYDFGGFCVTHWAFYASALCQKMIFIIDLQSRTCVDLITSLNLGPSGHQWSSHWMWHFLGLLSRPSAYFWYTPFSCELCYGCMCVY